MLTTMVILVSALLGVWLYDLFTHEFGMGGSDLELSTLVAPVPVPEDAPPPPKAENEPEKKQVNKDENVDIRKEIIQNIFESPAEVPKINTEKTSERARRLGVDTKIGASDSDARGTPSGTGRTLDPGSGGTGLSKEAPPPIEKDDDDPPPPPPPKPTPKPAPKTISGGVVNGKAISLPAPPYPAAAKAVGAKGSVSVQVLIDENGNVVSASAASGHPLLRSAAEQAARRAKFKPTELSGQPVKVSGVITYVFN